MFRHYDNWGIEGREDGETGDKIFYLFINNNKMHFKIKKFIIILGEKSKEKF